MPEAELTWMETAFWSFEAGKRVLKGMEAEAAVSSLEVWRAREMVPWAVVGVRRWRRAMTRYRKEVWEGVFMVG